VIRSGSRLHKDQKAERHILLASVNVNELHVLTFDILHSFST